MIFDIMTLFPDLVNYILNESIIGRAQKSGAIEVCTYNIRDYSTDKHRRVDDTPYGGGCGMVLTCQPMFDAIRSIEGEKRVILMTPQGKQFKQCEALRLSKEEHIVLVCGHYEGFDERIRTLCDEELSIGDYVLTGGELPAMVMIDAISRLIPNVLNNKDSAEYESFTGNLLEHPQYTRPENYQGKKVPEVLLSGHHAKIEAWKKEQSLIRTKKYRPDLFKGCS